jgi:hypothetical protein
MSVRLVAVALMPVARQPPGLPISLQNTLSDHLSETLAESGWPAVAEPCAEARVAASRPGYLGLVRPVDPGIRPSAADAGRADADRQRLAYGHRADLAGRVTIDVHLTACLDGFPDSLDGISGDQRWPECADVICWTKRDLPSDSATRWITHTLRRYPGCLLAVVEDAPGRLVVAARHEQRFHTYARAGDAWLSPCQRDLFASFLHGWLAAGNRLQALCSIALGCAVDCFHRLP